MSLEVIKTALFEVTVTTPDKILFDLENLSYEDAMQGCNKVLTENKDDEKLCEILSDCMRNFGFVSRSDGGYSVHISSRAPHTKTNEVQTCRSRMDQFGPWERAENLDHWNLIGKDKCCSFCGSLHPDRVIELIKEHGFEILDPSTKGYKWYINQPNVPNAGFGGIKYYRWHDTKEFIDEFNKLIDQLKKDKENNEQTPS